MKSAFAQNHRTSPKFDRDWNLDDCTWRTLGHIHASPLGELDKRELLVQSGMHVRPLVAEPGGRMGLGPPLLNFEFYINKFE